jgi:2-polyprenyl-3-methyl-5-hydroxy-6-metoxy-1,4-benzoquinol methylase
MLQPLDELEKWHSSDDPWGYETHPEDIKRKDILLSELPQKKYNNVLDIGCGHGFVTRDLPGKRVVGVDISHEAIKQAKTYETDRITFLQSSLFDLNRNLREQFDLIVITGVLYPQYVANAHNLVYHIIDKLLMDSGILVSVHIDAWYKARFPYLQLNDYYYDYREYTHRLEVYVK